MDNTVGVELSWYMLHGQLPASASGSTVLKAQLAPEVTGAPALVALMVAV